MTAARVLPARRTSRASLVSACVGALLAVLAWAAWSALDAGDSTAATVAPVALGAPAVRPITTATASSRDAVPAAEASAVQAGVAPRQDARALPVVPDGFAMVHGQLTAVRAPAVPTAAPIAPMAVTLPAGVRPVDAVVSPTGMVAVMHTGAGPANAAPNPPRLVTATNSP